MIPEGTSTNDLENFAAEIWRRARDHASVMDSLTPVLRIRDGMVYLRDHYAARNEADKTLLDAKTELTGKLITLIRTVHAACPVCQAKNGDSHESRCWLRCCTPGRWTQLSPKSTTKRKYKKKAGSSVSVEDETQPEPEPEP